MAPDWLLVHSQPEWGERYSERIEDYHLPKSKKQRIEQAEIYGKDGLQLLNAVFQRTSPTWLRQIPAVEMLRRVWLQPRLLLRGPDSLAHPRRSTPCFSDDTSSQKSLET